MNGFFNWAACDERWQRIGPHLDADRFEATPAREGWYVVRWAHGTYELHGVVWSDVVPGVLLCDGDPVGAHGERYYFLGELT